MKRMIIMAAGLLVAAQAQAGLVAHEWGTFTSVVGSNGISQNGMIQEDEELPSFVHSFGSGTWQQNLVQSFTPILNAQANCPGFPKVPCQYLSGQAITQKMETPVVYFYSDKAQDLRFEVGFPQGIISQSYPAPTRTEPLAIPGVDLKAGYADYRIEILAKDNQAQPPHVDPENIYIHARKTQSNLIRSGDEVEKFIFYRGIGEFDAKLKARSEGGTLSLKNSSDEAIPHVFLVHTTEEGRGQIRALGGLSSNQDKFISQEEIAEIQAAETKEHFVAKARAQLVEALMTSGLYKDEAVAMIDTWEHGYFQTPGLRLLYVLPQSEVEELLPAKITPQPDDFQRVFVGRIEVLLDRTEYQLLDEIIEKGDQFPVERLGALALPTLTRIQQVAEEDGVLDEKLRDVFTALRKRI